MPLVALSPEGLYCEAGRFHVDPWRGVDRAIVTHAHADHARPGSRTYLASAEGEGVLRERVGADASIDTLAWGESRAVNGVRVSMHPAGHILGSAQVRLEYRGQVCVVSGDYRDAEPVRCHTFISESTFGLPIYRWRPESEIVADICAWWDANRADGKTSVLFAYALGKAQRILAGLVPCKAPVLVHGAVARFLPHYAAAGIEMPATRPADLDAAKETRGEALVIAPPSAFGTTWLRKFK
ncbi:MAG: DNA ligase-associated DEXH box helicase, partial [Planctomycetota bacterium]